MAPGCLPLDRGFDDNPLRTVWIALTIDNPVLFLATTYYAAAHLDMVHGRQFQAKTLTKKAQTISMINKQLSCSKSALRNSTIGAIAMLAAADVSGHSLHPVVAHDS